jgi:putative PIN family toxin of toxin-antitoxin system
MIKVVLDTNIFISGFFWKGIPYKILDAWRHNIFTNYTSLSIVNEIADTFRYFRIRLPEEDIYNLTSLIIEKSVIIKEDWTLNFPVRDYKDNKFIQCAVGGQVDYILTQDKDLLVLGDSYGFKIIKPDKFIKIMPDVF